jgi:hypothetical protein
MLNDFENFENEFSNVIGNEFTEEDALAEGQSAHQQELEEKEANEKGFCFHCGEKLEDCSGYKCWK